MLMDLLRFDFVCVFMLVYLVRLLLLLSLMFMFH